NESVCTSVRNENELLLLLISLFYKTYVFSIESEGGKFQILSMEMILYRKFAYCYLHYILNLCFQ
ncbi:MAG: hypothetical protein ACXWEW_07470, partial [Nitrososphaeraceae archaeon]